MPLIATRGAASAQGFGEFAQATAVNYIEDVFSTWLYTGTTAVQTITNGIDLSTKGGMVWIKDRSFAYNNAVMDSARGLTNGNILYTNTTNAAMTGYPENTAGISAFNTNGFTLRADANGVGTNYGLNVTPENYVSWTFREQAKFFDIVTYTGNGAAARAINHSLGSVPGCMIVKSASEAGNWRVYHRGCSTNNGLVLNDYGAQTTSAIYWFGDEVNVIPPTSTQFTVNAGFTNINGATYVAYLFAHNAGGFGLSGSDNVITCGSYTGNGSTTGPVVTLNYEPQWLLIKSVTDATDWNVVDNMRGFWVGDTSTTSNSPRLRPNQSNTEQASGFVIPNATGFQLYGPNAASSTYNGSGSTYIYIAIRRGPMKVPTDATKVFKPIIGDDGTFNTTNFVVDMVGDANPGGGTTNTAFMDRLRGGAFSKSTSTAAETANYPQGFQSNTAVSPYIFSPSNSIMWNFSRAPGYFDVVCYTGNGTAGLSVSHNLTVPPEMLIVKRRNSTGDWPVLMRNVDRLGSAGSSYRVNSTASWDPAGPYFSDSSGTFVPATDATSTVFRVSNAPAVNDSAGTYVAYLFATCAGVSKVGSYTGTAALLTVNCGFAAGARFVLIKRADASGDWYAYNSASGISSGTDPYMLLNSTAAETTGTNYVDTDTTGFKVTAAAPAGLNANGGTYIFLAIA